MAALSKSERQLLISQNKLLDQERLIKYKISSPDNTKCLKYMLALCNKFIFEFKKFEFYDSYMLKFLVNESQEMIDAK